MVKAERIGIDGKPSRTSLYGKLGFILVFVTAGLIYYWFQSPTYAVLELEKSIQERDLATFYSRLDLNRIYDSTLDANAVLETPGESPWETLQAKIGASVQKILKSQVMNEIKRDIELHFRRDVKSSLANQNAKGGTTVSLQREFFEDSFKLQFGKVARSGEMALVNIEVDLQKMGKSYPLTLKLEKIGNWKVTGFEGLASSLSLYDKDRIIRVNEHNAKMEQEFLRLVPFFGQLREEPSLLNIGQDLKFEFLFHNKSETILDRIEGVLLVQNAKGEIVLKESFARTDLNLNGNEKKVFLISKDIGVLGSKVAFSDGLTLAFQMEKIGFKDGKVLQLVQSYQEL